MLGLYATSKFKKDLKACKKQGKDINLLVGIVDTLRIPSQLPAKNRDHSLTGNYSGTRECHIEPDWLLVYRIEDQVLVLERTGSHSDLFR